MHELFHLNCRGKSYSSVMGWVRACLSYAILRATMICVRGSRVKWKSLGIVDGASVKKILE